MASLSAFRGRRPAARPIGTPLTLAVFLSTMLLASASLGGRRGLQQAQNPGLTPQQAAVINNAVQNAYGQIAQPYVHQAVNGQQQQQGLQQQQGQQQQQQQPQQVITSGYGQGQGQGQAYGQQTQGAAPQPSASTAALASSIPASSSVPAASPSTPASTPASSTFSSSSDALSLHNQYRAAHRAGALSWSPSLEASAQGWADRLASGCSFYHSGTSGVGENLAAGYNSWAEAAAAWYNEIKQYSYSSGSFSEATGHATQMLWQATTQLGCATAQSAQGCWQRTVYVCHYNPPGNVMGQFQENVLAPSQQ